MKTTSTTTSSSPKVGGIGEVAATLGVKPDQLTKAKMAGDFISPVGTVSGRDAYDMGQAQKWARTHLGTNTGPTRTATRATGATRMARTASTGRTATATRTARGGRKTR